MSKQPIQMQSSPSPELLAIVEVSFEDRVRCGQPGCGHAVHKAVHVVQDGGAVVVLGSSCFGKRFGRRPSGGNPRYTSSSGRVLSAEERQLLVENAALLIARFETELQAQRKQAAEIAAKPLERPRQVASASKVSFTSGDSSPWSWKKPLSSIAFFRLRDGTGWVRVQHRDLRQLLVPWPEFEGWDEALPPTVGIAAPDVPAYVIHDLPRAVTYLRDAGTWDEVFGKWGDLVTALKHRAGQFSPP